MTDQTTQALSGTLERGLAILQLFAVHGELAPARVARELDLSRSATYRIVERLRGWGYLEDAPGGDRLRLGVAAARLGMAALASVDVVRVAPEHLRTLARAAGETVNLGVLDGDTIVYIHQEEGPHAVRLTAHMGTRRPVYCTGLGKAFLAALPAAARDALLDRTVLVPRTANTIVDRAALERELEATARRGYAVDRIEVEEGVACFAAVVRNHAGEALAAISVAGPSERVLRREPEIAPLVTAAAATISERLGFRGGTAP